MKKALLISIMLIVIAGMFIACSEEEEDPTLNITSLTATPDSLG